MATSSQMPSTSQPFRAHRRASRYSQRVTCALSHARRREAGRGTRQPRSPRFLAAERQDRAPGRSGRIAP
jgi:hypothetical protein